MITQHQANIRFHPIMVILYIGIVTFSFIMIFNPHFFDEVKTNPKTSLPVDCNPVLVYDQYGNPVGEVCKKERVWSGFP